MRQSHQKSRSRGRNRKPQNPLSRNFESNGPDVKIRGNAGHIAEKYSTLARDALSNGDTVMAENYFQHAEHYNRLIAAAQAQRAEEQAQRAEEQAAQNNGRGPQPDIDGAEDAPSAASDDKDTDAPTTDAGDNSTDEGNNKKQARGRRTKRAPVSADGDQDESSEAREKKTRGRRKPNGNGDSDASRDDAGDKNPAEAEVISEDAASLPQSITGGLRAEEA